jgi:hypothetical protein
LQGKEYVTRRERGITAEMSPLGPMVLVWISCLSALSPLRSARLTSGPLEARPDPAHEIEPVVECELQHGHPGSHLALGQSYGDAAELWLRWQPGQPAGLLKVDEPGYCTAEGPDPEEPGELMECHMPAGHPGAHSFQLQLGQTGGRVPSPESQRRLEEALRQALSG